MNQLATMTNGSAIGQISRSEGNVPRWLAYLVAAYPTAKNSPMTYVVLTDQFQGVPGTVLYEAARLYVREGSKWFPSAFEFRPFVERVQAEAEIDQVTAARQAVVTDRAKLRARRDDLLPAWYDGEVSVGDLLGLAGEMAEAGMEYAAASLRTKAQPVVERPGYAEFVARYAERLRGAAANNQG